MAAIKFVTDWIKSIRDKLFLKKHGCTSWEEYNYVYDPDIRKNAIMVYNYYHGYPYIYQFTDYKHQVYEWDFAANGQQVLQNWCKAHCKDKFRFDFLRVYKNRNEEYEISGLGNNDYIYVAFKNEKDYMLFLLRWS